jgi:hypothetical protein
MTVNKMQKLQILITALLLSAAMHVSAIPITGEIGMTGSFTALKSDSTVTSDLTQAVAIDFADDKFTLNTATGDFTSLTLGSTGTITDVEFDPFTGPVASFWTIDAFSFELTSLTKVFANTNVLFLRGTGTISAAGFDDTAGEWLFSGNTTGGSFAWSAGTTAIPEPGMLMLLGIGLIGLTSRRFWRKLGTTINT